MRTEDPNAIWRTLSYSLLRKDPGVPSSPSFRPDTPLLLAHPSSFHTLTYSCLHPLSCQPHLYPYFPTKLLPNFPRPLG